MSDLVPSNGHLPSSPPGPVPPGMWMPVAESPPAADVVNLREIFAVLRRNLGLVLGIAALTLAGTVFVLSRQVPEYRAQATIRLKNECEAISGGLDGRIADQVVGRGTDPVLSQIQVLKSRGIATAVVERTGLRLHSPSRGFAVSALEGVAVAADAPPDTLSLRFGRSEVIVRGVAGEARVAYGAPVEVGGVRFTVPARPEGVEEAEVVVLSPWEAEDRVLEGLKARPREETDVVDVTFTASDPRLAQAVVNAAVEVFREADARAAQAQARRRRIFIEEQLAETDSILAEAQLALSEFRRREQVYSSGDKFAAQQVGLMGLEVRREELDADRRMYRSLLDRLKRADSGVAEQGLRTLVSTPGIAENAVVAQLFARLVAYESARDSMVAAGSVATNPDMQRLEAQLASVRSRLAEAVESHVAALDARIAALDDLRQRSVAEFRTLPATEAEEARLVQRVETVRKVSDQLREEYQRSRIAEAVEAGQVEVVDWAAVPRKPIGSGRALKLVLGLVLGLMLGSGVAFLREHLDTAVRSRSELEGLLHVPGLALIPRIAPSRSARPRSSAGRQDDAQEALVTVTEARSAGAEAFRTLRTNLIFSQAVQAIKTMVVTSAGPSEGKTTTSANLAVTFAQQGLRVLLVDGDLRRSRLHQVFGLPREPGLTEALIGREPIEDVIRATAVQGLDILPAGTLPPSPPELLGGARMRELLAELARRYDVVVLDAPPVHAASDASILGTLADGVLMVVRVGRTHREAALAAVQQLQSLGVRVVGAVLNDPEARAARYGEIYAYQYYDD